jgi:hypothetical protein
MYMQFIPVVVTALVAYALAMWNPAWLRNLPGSGIAGAGGLNYAAIAVISLIAGCLAVLAMGNKDGYIAYMPVLAAALTVLAVGMWNSPSFSKFPGGSDAVMAISALLVGGLAQYLCSKY